MKPYFTKYLPVEGEIKTGDKVESESSGKPKVTVTGITEDGNYITDEKDWYEPDSYFVLPKEKAKKFSKNLFLCSRNIQVGDKVFSEAMNQANLKVPDAFVNPYITINTEEEKEIFTKAGCIKVIGEISSEATWVKEGDEFDKNEIEFPWTTSVDNYTNLFAKIKGPCGHFH